MTKVGSTKIVNLITPGAEVLVLGHGHLSHLVKKHCFYIEAYIRQTESIVIMTKVKST